MSLTTSHYKDRIDLFVMCARRHLRKEVKQQRRRDDGDVRMTDDGGLLSLFVMDIFPHFFPLPGVCVNSHTNLVLSPFTTTAV